MKKLLAILLAVMMLFSLTGCGMENLLSGLGGESPEGVKNTKNPALIGTWKLVVEEESPTDEGADATGTPPTTAKPVRPTKQRQHFRILISEWELNLLRMESFAMDSIWSLWSPLPVAPI